jgi:hypothetical protein
MVGLAYEAGSPACFRNTQYLDDPTIRIRYPANAKLSRLQSEDSSERALKGIFAVKRIPPYNPINCIVERRDRQTIRIRRLTTLSSLCTPSKEGLVNRFGRR